MKKLIILFALLTLIPQTAFAHPGRTDANGGHHCWTNCEKWGYETGSYHYHTKEVKTAPEVKLEAKDKARS